MRTKFCNKNCSIASSLLVMPKQKQNVVPLESKKYAWSKLGNLETLLVFWQYNEGGINASWCIYGGNHFHLLEKRLSCQKKQPYPWEIDKLSFTLHHKTLDGCDVGIIWFHYHRHRSVIVVGMLVDGSRVVGLNAVCDHFIFLRCY